MKKTITNQLKSYSLIAGSLVAASSAQGAKIYMDLDPDIVVTSANSPYELIMEGAGVDMNFIVSTTLSSSSSTGSTGSDGINVEYIAFAYVATGYIKTKTSYFTLTSTLGQHNFFDNC
ncbi:MAG: hypothetical protein HRT71_20585 [Flavobacteriales bacterium]|nr:hypothetical protein [Flavobacteriales bacterium]